MSPLSEQELEVFRFRESFTLYEISMLGIGEGPICESMETRGKPVSYYVICSELIKAIKDKTIDPKAVMLDKASQSRAHDSKFGLMRPYPDNDTGDIRYQGFDPYFVSIEREAIVKWAILIGQKPEFLAGDIEELEKSSGSLKKGEPSPGPRTKLKDLTLIVKDQALLIIVGKKRKEVDYPKAGFEDKKTGRPNQLWALLKLFARRNGEIDFNDSDVSEKVRDNRRQYISKLRKRLKTLLKTQDNPIKCTDGKYETRFRISTKETKSLVSFPSNIDSWSSISIAEEEDGSFLISVKQGVPEGHDKNLKSIPATSTRKSEHRYDLRALGLVDNDGNPTRAGNTFLELLRAGGELKRDPNDDRMIQLSVKLNNLFKIQEMPFKIDEKTGMWSAKFQAVSYKDSLPR